MLVWDETDLIECLEVVPEVEHDSIWHRYLIEKHRLKLEILLFQYDGDVSFKIMSDDVEVPIFSMTLKDCAGIKYTKEEKSEFLEFAHSKCFESRYDGEAAIPFGVRVRVNPSIQVSVF